MLDLNKYSGKDKSAYFHSSGHAQLGQGSAIGSASNQTFSQRQAMSGTASTERTVTGYHRSQMGSQYSKVRAKRFEPQNSQLGTRRRTRQAFNAGDNSGVSEAPSAGRQAFNARGGATPPPAGFKEPPSRGFNPYA